MKYFDIDTRAQHAAAAVTLLMLREFVVLLSTGHSSCTASSRLNSQYSHMISPSIGLEDPQSLPLLVS